MADGNGLRSGERRRHRGTLPAAAGSRSFPRRIGLILLSAVLLSLAYQPFGRWYLAWVAMVPWLVVVREVVSIRSAFGWGWVSGLLFFAANLWWLWTATIPGAVALCVYFALYWGLAAALIRGLAPLDIGGLRLGRRSAEPGGNGRAVPLVSRPAGWRLVLSIVVVSVTWTATEFLRTNLIRGFPWMMVGHSQSPIPALCQIADATGVPGITAGIMLVNALLAVALTPAHRWRPLAGPAVVAATVCAGIVAYGCFRLAQTPLRPGPRVMVVQPNHPHKPGGDRTVSREEAVAYHLDTTTKALAAEQVDLIVWSETVAPPLNDEARRQLSSTEAGRFMERTHQQIAEIAAGSGAAFVTGANWVGGWKKVEQSRVATDLRNSAYLYLPDGPHPAGRYDKTELVLFSERVPFHSGPAWLHRLMLWLSPPVASQPLTPGDPTATPVFTINPKSTRVPGYRFVTPICLESIFPDYVAGLIHGGQDRGKRADLIVNLSNDGWFSPVERYQHLEQIVFRCIENRVPQARASNTGISGFIDSCGRVLKTLPPGAEGALTDLLLLDDRVALYARRGDWFAAACVLGVAALVAAKSVFWRLAPARRPSASGASM